MNRLRPTVLPSVQTKADEDRWHCEETIVQTVLLVLHPSSFLVLQVSFYNFQIILDEFFVLHLYLKA